MDQICFVGLAVTATFAESPAVAQDANLAKKLSNPAASPISVPFQFNCDSGFGPDDGSRVLTNFQPVAPITSAWGGRADLAGRAPGSTRSRMTHGGRSISQRISFHRHPSNRIIPNTARFAAEQ